MNKFADSLRKVVNMADPQANSPIAIANKNLKVLADWTRKACVEIDKLQAELEQYQPISVSEGLPDRNTYCHLYMPSVNANSPFKGWYLTDKKHWLTTLKSHSRTNKVTHWWPVILPGDELKGE